MIRWRRDARFESSAAPTSLHFWRVRAHLGSILTYSDARVPLFLLVLPFVLLLVLPLVLSLVLPLVLLLLFFLFLILLLFLLILQT